MRFRKFLKPYKTRGSSFREHTMIQEGDQMCEELKELLAPEIMEFKIRLAEQDARLTDQDTKLADKDAEIAKLKKILTDAGIKI